MATQQTIINCADWDEFRQIFLKVNLRSDLLERARPFLKNFWTACQDRAFYNELDRLEVELQGDLIRLIAHAAAPPNGRELRFNAFPVQHAGIRCELLSLPAADENQGTRMICLNPAAVFFEAGLKWLISGEN